VAEVAARADGPGRAEQALVAAMAATAVIGVAAVHGARPALLSLPMIALSLVWRPATLPGWIARPAPRVVRVALAAVFLMRAAMTLYPVLDDERVARVALATGSLLVPLLAASVLGTRRWRPALGAVPLSIALVAVASFVPGESVRAAQVVEALLAMAYLAVAIPRLEPPTGRRRTGPRAAALAVFAVGAALLAVLLARVLPWAQPHVEDAAARLLNPSFPIGQAGFSASSSLGDIQRLALSRSVVLRVWTPMPRKLRGRVLMDFDGHTWRASAPEWRDLPAVSVDVLPAPLAGWLAALPGTSFGDPRAAARGNATRTRVVQAEVLADTLFAPTGVVLARVGGSRLRSDRFEVLEAPADPPGLYALIDVPSGGAPPSGPEALTVPADTDARLRALAARLAAGDPPSSVKLGRTLDYLWRECRYSLDVGKFATRQPVAEFVFDKKRGYCEYFASAAVVLLRLQGVPTRYVTGFSMDAAETVGEHYVVRESDAHAWIEAWLPDRGWVEADPTPAGDYAAVHGALASRLDRLVEWFKGHWAEAMLALRTGGLRRLLRMAAGPAAVLALVLLGAAAARARRRGGVAAAVAEEVWEADPALASLMRRVEALWARHGCPRPPHRAPFEHVRGLEPARLPPGLRRTSEDVVDCYYRARYAGRPPLAGEVQGLARRLEDRAP
jgi:transglutaminase-like putative cysteine protease